jgi:hypothetical protein
MYKITLLYQSDIEGIYTSEQETATDLEQLQRKRVRMLRKWAKIFNPEIPFRKIKKQSAYVLKELIQNNIIALNRDAPGNVERDFLITIEIIIKKSEVKTYAEKIGFDKKHFNLFEVLMNDDSDISL